MKIAKQWIYDYRDKCDCSEDDKCGCSYPENMEHNFQEYEHPEKTTAPEKTNNKIC